MSTLGIPYANWVGPDLTDKQCPVCGTIVHCEARKDFESLSGIEYARHYEAEHAATGPGAG